MQMVRSGARGGCPSQVSCYSFLVQLLILLSHLDQGPGTYFRFSLDFLRQTGLTPGSVSLLYHRTITNTLILCKVHVPWFCEPPYQGGYSI